MSVFEHLHFVTIYSSVLYKVKIRLFFKIMAIAIFLGVLYGIYPCCERKKGQNLKFTACRAVFVKGPFLTFLPYFL